MIELVIFVLGTLAIAATWDVFRRSFAHSQEIADLRKAFETHSADLEVKHQAVKGHVENLLNIIQAAKAGQANRMPPRIMQRG